MLWYHSQINIHPPIEILGQTLEAVAPDFDRMAVRHDSDLALVQTAMLALVVTVVVLGVVVVGAVGEEQGSSKASSTASLGWRTIVINPAKHDGIH